MRTDDAQILEVLHGQNPTTFTEAANERMWESVPRGMHLVHFTRQSVPAEYIASFGSDLAAVPPTRTAYSAIPSQLSSMPLTISVAPGWTAGLASSQSVLLVT